MIRIAVLVRKIGPYHDARYRALAREFEVTALQVRPGCEDYGWKFQADKINYVVQDATGTNPREFQRNLCAQLADIDPGVVALTGYSDPEVQIGLAWCLRNRVPTFVMSDSQEMDAPRSFWRERLKRMLVCTASAGLAAGTTSAAYLASLGIPAKAIFRPYDVVDNDYFERAVHLRPEMQRGGDAAFLCVARFIEKKNLFRLLECYQAYREQKENPWRLILAGDGPLRNPLMQRIAELGLTATVSLPGFVQYEDLPKLYASAQALIIPSLIEQWGLVVNEAMAAGLPVLVSKNCGCAPDLVKVGENGFLFDPLHLDELTQLMERIARTDVKAMGAASQRLIESYSLTAFAEGFRNSVEIALTARPRVGALRQNAIRFLGERGLRQIFPSC